MLKQKHYPHATVAAVVLLTVAPLSLLLLSSLWRPPAPEHSRKSAVSMSDAEWMAESGLAEQSSPAPESAPSENSAPQKPATVSSDPGTVTARATTGMPAQPADPPLRPFTEGSTILSVRAAPSSPAADPSASADTIAPQTVVPARPLPSMRPELVAEPVAAIGGNAEPVPQPEDKAATEEPEYPKPVPVSESYFAATGHLLLANIAQLVPESASEDKDAADEVTEEPMAKPKKADRVQKNGSRQEAAAVAAAAQTATTPTISKSGTPADPLVADRAGARAVPLPTPENAVVPDFGEDEFFGTTGPRSRTVSVGGPTADTQLEDVILQTPLETRQVDRVENVIGVTGARGFPIALVRSDLPDDDWWVQQMVGMRGNTFAARVNFGNESSISGSVYHMVIVFLDSPDEARRFRIAKRFDDLPEGIRRSREFRYVRK